MELFRCPCTHGTTRSRRATARLIAHACAGECPFPTPSHMDSDGTTCSALLRSTRRRTESQSTAPPSRRRRPSLELRSGVERLEAVVIRRARVGLGAPPSRGDSGQDRIETRSPFARSRELRRTFLVACGAESSVLRLLARAGDRVPPVPGVAREVRRSAALGTCARQREHPTLAPRRARVEGA